LVTGRTIARCMPSTPPDNRVVLDIDPTSEYPRNSEARSSLFRDGAILYSYTQFYGGASDHSRARIVSIVSLDDGPDMEEPAILVEKRGGFNVMSSSFLRLADGRIALFYLVKERPSRLQALCARCPRTMARHWSEACPDGRTPVGYFVMTTTVSSRPASDASSLPWRSTVPFTATGKNRPTGEASPCGSSRMTPGRLGMESRLWWAMPEHGDKRRDAGAGSRGNWLTAHFQLGAQPPPVSSTIQVGDGGRTFSAPYRTSLVSPVSPASIKRIPGTHRTFAQSSTTITVRLNSRGRRTPLVAALSRDGGVTWQSARRDRGRSPTGISVIRP
jgi:hypothetical protein